MFYYARLSYLRHLWHIHRVRHKCLIGAGPASRLYFQLPLKFNRVPCVLKIGVGPYQTYMAYPVKVGISPMCDGLVRLPCHCWASVNIANILINKEHYESALVNKIDVYI